MIAPPESGTKLTWMLILKLGNVIHVLVDNDEHVIALVVRRNVALGERLGHFESSFCLPKSFENGLSMRGWREMQWQRQTTGVKV